MENPFQNAIILTGPTGAGKSKLALGLAERLDCEIVSMDSMSLYRHMDIGTAKPSLDDRQRVPHHLLDVLNPSESASVAWWLEQATRISKEIESRQKLPLFVGGTPLYIKAMFHGLFDGPGSNLEIRSRLEEETKEIGRGAMHQRLARVDKRAAAKLHPNDIRRVVRALEVWEITGKPISDWQQQWSTMPACVRGCFWLDWPREQLYDRINQRVDDMFAKGLVDEVRRLLALPQPLSKAASQALGYKEVIAGLHSGDQLSDIVHQVKTRTRQFAKRQITWLRHLPFCKPVSQELTIDDWCHKMINVK